MTEVTFLIIDEFDFGGVGNLVFICVGVVVGGVVGIYWIGHFGWLGEFRRDFSSWMEKS